MDDREEIDRLKASRRGFKAALTRTRRAVENLIEDHIDRDDPTLLENHFAIWTQRWDKFQKAEEAVICHPEADIADADKDIDEHEDAYARAQTRIVTFRRNCDHAQVQPVAVPVGAVAGAEAVGDNRLPRLDIKKPPILKENTDHRAFMRWKPLWENYTQLVQLPTRPRNVQVGMFWECCSPGFLRTVNNSIGVKVDTNRPLQEVHELIERYLRSLRSRHMDMRDLLAIRQGEAQSYTSLCNEIRELADYADTTNITEDLLLIGLLLQAMRREEDKAKCMQKNPATFNDAKKFILELETARQDARAIGRSGQRSSVDEFDVDFVKKQSSYKKKKGRNVKKEEPKSNYSEVKDCQACGRDHKKDACPAKNQKCNKCMKIGHFASRCQTKTSNLITIGRVYRKSGKVPVEMSVAGRAARTTWYPDTGADCNVMGLTDFESLNLCAHLEEDCSQIRATVGLALPLAGKVSATLKLGDKEVETDVHILRGTQEPLLGKPSCIALGLIEEGWPHTRWVQHLSLKKPGDGMQVRIEEAKGNSVAKEALIKKFPEVFPPDDDILPLKKMAGPPMKIHLREGAIPIKKYRAAPIPFHWQEKVKCQLDAMVAKGIAEKVPVGEVPEWILSMVVVPKTGTNEPRLTVNFQPMNPYVIRTAHPCGVPAEEVAQIPPGMKYSRISI